MKYLSYLLIRLVIALVAILPFPVIYMLSDLTAFCLRNLIRYRSKVIDKNLSICFPNKSKVDRSQIKIDFYKNLSDIIFESLAAFGKKSSKIIPRLKFTNSKEVERFHTANTPIIVMGAHFGNWEYPNIAIPSQQLFTMAAMVKPISNPYLDKYTNIQRSRTGAQMISTYGSQRELLRKTSNPRGFVFISDQYPPNQERAIKACFFGKHTTFLHGAQQIAKKKNYPLFGVKIKRTNRGHYEMSVALLCENPKQYTEIELTQLYANYLENMILEDPASWMWSHKRWKAELNY